MKAPKEAIESHLIADRDLQSQRKLKIAEERLKVEIAKLKASEKEVQLLSKRLEVFDGLTGIKKSVWKPKSSAKHGSATAVVLLSDLHVEEGVDPKKVNWLNEYNLEIADASLKEVFQRSLKLLNHERQLVNIKDMVIHVGGDEISGFIHDELVEGNSLSPLAACRWVQERLENGIRFLLENGELDSVKIVTSYGNHGRTGPKRRIATGAENSFEHNMYLAMRASMEHPNLSWQIGDGYLNYLDIQGYTCRFHHGDALRYHGAIGGITTTVEKAIRCWDQQVRADFSFCGHYHQHRSGPKWVMNGSLIGYNPYAIEIKAEFEEPSQTFCVIDKDRGMTVVKKIFCRPPYRKTKP